MNNFRRTARALLAAVLFFDLLPLSAQTEGDWHRFLGPSANATSKERGLLDKFPAGGVPALWERTIGTGYSAPSILGDRLVLFHRLQKEEIVECLNAGTGKTVWRHTYPTSYEDPYGYNNGPRCAPILTTNRCYTFGVEGRLTCLDLATGKPVWTRETASEWNVPSAFFGVGSTPWLEGDRLLVMVGGQPDSAMVAFHAETGKTLWESGGRKNWEGKPMLGWPGDRTVVWKVTEKQASYSSPVVASIHGKPVALCLTRQGMMGLNPANGEVLFSRWFRSMLNDSVNAMTPLVQGDKVFFSAAYYKVGSVLMQLKPGLTDFSELWRGIGLELHWSQPILLDNALYAFSGRNEPDARFRCVEFETGKVLWERDESWPPHSSEQPPVFGRASAIHADGKMIVLGEGGLLGLFKPTREAPGEISRWQVPKLKYPCWAGPVLARKRLYLRSENQLVCLDFAGK